MSQKTLLTKGILKELWFTTARSGGKGGQNVNKVATKVELFFDVNNSLTIGLILLKFLLLPLCFLHQYLFACRQ